MNPLKTNKQDQNHNNLLKEYASLAVERLKNGDGPKTLDKTKATEIEKRMKDIRSELNLGHATILSKAVEIVG